MVQLGRITTRKISLRGCWLLHVTVEGGCVTWASDGLVVFQRPLWDTAIQVQGSDLWLWRKLRHYILALFINMQRGYLV